MGLLSPPRPAPCPKTETSTQRAKRLDRERREAVEKRRQAARDKEAARRQAVAERAAARRQAAEAKAAAARKVKETERERRWVEQDTQTSTGRARQREWKGLDPEIRAATQRAWSQGDTYKDAVKRVEKEAGRKLSRPEYELVYD
jgi:hypothetical protein